MRRAPVLIGAAVVLIAITAIALSLRPSAQAPPKAPPPSPYDWARLDAALERMVEENQLPGAAAIVVDANGTLYERTYGDYTLDTWVTTGSASKWASAAALLTLVDDGTLSLNDPIAKFVPSFDRPDKERITLAMALSHRTGLAAKHDCLRSYRVPLSNCVDKIAQSQLLYEPDQGFGYGSLSYHAAAAMAENATGQSFREIFQSRIARPLGMVNTRFGRGGRSPNPGVAGNLVSSARDYSVFLQMMLNYGVHQGQRILSEELVVEMERPHQGRGLAVNHVPDRHLNSHHDYYGYGLWRDVVTPKGELLLESAPGKFGFTPWLDRRMGVAGVIVAEWNEAQLKLGKPPDPAGVMYIVCDIIDRATHPEAATPNPHCHIRGVDELWGVEP